MVKTAYKVRLEDGMEVGPLDGEMIRSWYQQGMANPDTMIRAQGSKRWVRLADTFEVASWGEPHGASPQAEEELEALESQARQTWRTYFACALFFLLAAASGYFLLFPSMWRMPGTPWREISLGFVVLGLLLVRGWEPMRKLVRVLVLLLTIGLFPLAEVLIFRGVPWRSLMVLLPAVVMGFGLFFFLSGRYKPWTRVVLNLFWILVGAAGVVLLGAFPPPAVAAWMAEPSPLPDVLRPAMLTAPPTQPSARVTTAPAARPEPVATAPAGTAPSAAAAGVGAPSAESVIHEVPLLSRAAADAVRARAVFAPEDAFRRSYEMAGNGVAALSATERRDLGELMAATYANIPASDRRRLEAYMTGIRGGQISTSVQNREMSAIMRDAVRRLPDSQRARLQALYEKAILAAR